MSTDNLDEAVLMARRLITAGRADIVRTALLQFEQERVTALRGGDIDEFIGELKSRRVDPAETALLRDLTYLQKYAEQAAADASRIFRGHPGPLGLAEQTLATVVVEIAGARKLIEENAS